VNSRTFIRHTIPVKSQGGVTDHPRSILRFSKGVPFRFSLLNSCSVMHATRFESLCARRNGNFDLAALGTIDPAHTLGILICVCSPLTLILSNAHGDLQGMI
jgi:hypothetical protein